MHQLTNLALEAILNEFHPQEYDPPHTDVREWIRSIESLCDTYGVPDTQRAQCAAIFVKGELRTELRNVLERARVTFGPVHWNQFKTFMIAFDEMFRKQQEELPFYRKHPKLVGTAVGVTSGVILAPVAVLGIILAPVSTLGALCVAGLTSAGVAVGIAAIIQSIVYGGATGGLFSLLQSASEATVLPSIGTVFTGATATGTGVAVATGDGQATTSDDLLHQAVESIAHRGNPNDEGGNPPPYRATPPEEELLTPHAILAIVKAWDVGTYTPPWTNCTSWLSDMDRVCDRYGIPFAQRAACAMRLMKPDCRGAAHTSGCYDMSWDEFRVWLQIYDREDRRNANRRIAELPAFSPTM